MMGESKLDPMLNRRFGGVTVVRLIGTGGMGAVYEARNAVLGKKYAIKVILPHLAHNQVAVDRFFAEARAAVIAEHPRLVPIIDCGTMEDGRPFQLMAFLEGQNLDRFCDDRGAQEGHQGRLELGTAAPLFFQILDGLAATHSHQIVHRDLKGTNVQVLPDETIKILDFGIAKLFDPLIPAAWTDSSRIVGTPGYMAPEQARCGVVDARTDLWALGVVFFRVLTGRLPFEGQTFTELAAQALLAPRPSATVLIPAIPVAVSRVIASCLAADPDDRPGSARELAHSLMAAVPDGQAIAERVAPDLALRSGPSDPTIPGRPPSSRERARAGPARRGSGPPMRILGLVAVLVVLAGMAVGMAARVITSHGEESEPRGPRPSRREPANAAPAQESGFLVITVDPFAHIYIDGKLAGPTPFMSELSVGRHRVELRGVGGKNEITRITIHAGKTIRMDRTWGTDDPPFGGLSTAPGSFQEPGSAGP